MFYPSEKFTWSKQLTDNWLAIRQEYDQIAADVIPWPEAIHNGLWSVYGIVFQNRDLNVKHKTPVTAKICDAIPGIQTYGFSVMKPQCQIRPHKGYTSKVLRCHLGLYTTSDAAIQVGQDIQKWHEGQVMVFDDTIIHSAWNNGKEDRVILLLDFLK
jgi:aspartyl/asparaginyl beta-hydroxylase (cupin superfamily)